MPLSSLPLTNPTRACVFVGGGRARGVGEAPIWVWTGAVQQESSGRAAMLPEGLSRHLKF